jgi:hypothetical protein
MTMMRLFCIAIAIIVKMRMIKTTHAFLPSSSFLQSIHSSLAPPSVLTLSMSARTWPVSFRNKSGSSSWYPSPSTNNRNNSSNKNNNNNNKNTLYVEKRNTLLQLLSQTPPNAATPPALTRRILQAIRDLEAVCPTPDTEVVPKLAGSWDLVWTTQDRTAPEARRLFASWINPLENQQYAINPQAAAAAFQTTTPLNDASTDTNTGRSNPFLPQAWQDRLERMGGWSITPSIQSTQAIDLNSQRVQNVVAVSIQRRRNNKNSDKQRRAQQGALTVSIDYKTDPMDARKLLVKFRSIRLVVPQIVKLDIPLGILGPTGWLHTGYVDDSLRITRGHKGSVFVLARTRSKASPVPPEMKE